VPRCGTLRSAVGRAVQPIVSFEPLHCAASDLNPRLAVLCSLPERSPGPILQASTWKNL
jgi:hypothetical protein